MKVDEFKALEKKINGRDFNQSYKAINTIMLVLSYVGHLASIFLAYFLISKVLSGAMSDSPTAVFIISIIILSALELLKRDIFRKFSIEYLKVKNFGKEVMPLLLLSALIISISFYSSISGASMFSLKGAKLESDKKEILTHYKDSVSLVYNDKIKLVEDEIKVSKGKIEDKDKEQTDIESVLPISRQQKSRVIDLKTEKSALKLDITKLEGNENSIKAELATNLKTKEEELSSDTNEKKSDNGKNSIIFVIISTIIELTILAGVYFHEYYDFRSYKEFRTKIDKDPNYQKWVLYESILNVIYGGDNKVNDKLSSTKNIMDMCKLNDVLVLPRDIVDFLKLAVNLNIIKSSGSSRYITKSRDISFEILKKHFNIE
jgi:hypothetical protein